jgi:hypothetical protein
MKNPVHYKSNFGFTDDKKWVVCEHLLTTTFYALQMCYIIFMWTILLSAEASNLFFSIQTLLEK